MRKQCNRHTDASAQVGRAYRGEIRSRRVLNALSKHLNACEKCRRLADALATTYGPVAVDDGAEVRAVG